MFTESKNKQYDHCMEAIKLLNSEIKALKSSKIYQEGKKHLEIKKEGVLYFGRKAMKLFSKRQHDIYRLRCTNDLDTAINHREDSNYYSDYRIAVYTCIIGNYDRLNEPLVTPDNIDYYAITDFEIDSKSAWKRINPNDYKEAFGLDRISQNRYFKFHPHVLFPEYEYSIYVDGNFRICTDFTEHVNRISKKGIGHFMHSKRNCAYMEAEVCRILKKETSAKIDAYVQRLRENDFPETYGLVACDIIVRNHNSELCKKIMSDWWYEFKNYLKRDQVSYPFVLYKNGVSISEIATLGGDVHNEYSFEILKHSK